MIFDGPLFRVVFFPYNEHYMDRCVRLGGHPSLYYYSLSRHLLCTLEDWNTLPWVWILSKMFKLFLEDWTCSDHTSCIPSFFSCLCGSRRWGCVFCPSWVFFFLRCLFGFIKSSCFYFPCLEDLIFFYCLDERFKFMKGS